MSKKIADNTDRDPIDGKFISRNQQEGFISETSPREVLERLCDEYGLPKHKRRDIMFATILCR